MQGEGEDVRLESQHDCNEDFGDEKDEDETSAAAILAPTFCDTESDNNCAGTYECSKQAEKLSKKLIHYFLLHNLLKDAELTRSK